MVNSRLGRIGWGFVHPMESFSSVDGCVARMAGGSASRGKLYFVFVKIMHEFHFFPSLLEHLVAVQNKKKSNCPWNEKNQQI